MGFWSIDQVGEWLKVVGFEKYVQKFKHQNIGGIELSQLSKYQIQNLLSVQNEDGTIQKPRIIDTLRFNDELTKWKKHCRDALSESIHKPFLASKNQQNSRKQLVTIIESKTPSLATEIDTNQYKYLINDQIGIQFFKNPKFAAYLINYVQQESFPIPIEIQQANDKLSSCFYTIEFSSSQQQAKQVSEVIERLFETVKSKIYNQTKVITWLRNPRAIDIIQTIMDHQQDLFTVCKLAAKHSHFLQIYYFDEEKFNHCLSTVRIDQLIHNHIQRLVFVLKWRDDKRPGANKSKTARNIVDESISPILREVQNKQARLFQEELATLVDSYKENELISVNHRNMTMIMTNVVEQHIQIFGYDELVNDVAKQIQDLKNKYCVTKYKLDSMTSLQIEYLINACRLQLKAIEKEFRRNHVLLLIRQRIFYAPPQLKDEIESRINGLLARMTTTKFTVPSLYYDIANKASLACERIARKHFCHGDIRIETITKPCTIPKATESESANYSISKTIVELSDLFCSSPMVHRQTTFANGSLGVLLGDIAAQQVDMIVIPSVSSGLKESLLERAGDIVQQPSQRSNKHSIPLIMETTAGRLPCKKILFVNRSISAVAMSNNENTFRASIRTFISKVIQYVVIGNRQSNMKTQSIAFSVPDLCVYEQILAEEMIYEAQRQMQSTESVTFNVLFVVPSDKPTLYREFLTMLSTMKTNDNSFALLFYPTSTITIALTSSDKEYLIRCEEKINNYLKRCVSEVALDGFNNWNQYLINYYYKYCSDRCVVPHLGNDQRITLKGSLFGVQEAKQKYQSIVTLIGEKIRLQQSSLEITSSVYSTPFLTTNYKIALSCCPNDLLACHCLANRLIAEGFTVWPSSDQVNHHQDALSHMEKSDCIILCISEAYCEDKSCVQEAQYANQMNKPIIAVKIQNCTPFDWLRQLLMKSAYFPMFGSEKQFDLIFDKLLLEILQYAMPAYISMQEQEFNPIIVPSQSTLTIDHQHITSSYIARKMEQRKLLYQTNLEHIINSKKGEITEDEKKTTIEAIEDIIQELEKPYKLSMVNNQHVVYLSNAYALYKERKSNAIKKQRYLESGILLYQHWLKEVPNLRTKQNISPFTVSGDINDAPFPIMIEILQDPALSFRTYGKPPWRYRGYYSSRNCNNSMYSGAGSNCYSDYFGGALYCGVVLHSSERYPALPYTLFGVPTEKEIKRRQHMVDTKSMLKRREEIGNYFMKNYKYVAEENLKSYLKFAQRMKDNAKELAKLSEMNTDSLREFSKNQTQASLTSIFCWDNNAPPKQDTDIITLKSPRQPNTNVCKHPVLLDRIFVLRIMF